MEENISQNAGKILIQIYLIYKQKNEVPNIEQLLKTTGLPKDALKRGLKYCYEKDFIDLRIFKTTKEKLWEELPDDLTDSDLKTIEEKIEGIGTTKMSTPFRIRDITAQGIDIIENPENKEEEKNHSI